MAASFDAMEIWRVRQQPPYDPGVGRIGNSLVLTADPQLHRYMNIGEPDGIKSESQARRCNNRGRDASIMAPYGRLSVVRRVEDSAYEFRLVLTVAADASGVGNGADRD